MSLLTSCNNGSASTSHFIVNLGGSGSDVAPCIKSSVAGAIRLTNTSTGMILSSDPTTAVASIVGGKAADGVLSLGSSAASDANIVLTDNAIALNGDVTYDGAVDISGSLTVSDGITVTSGGVVSQGGDFTLQNGYDLDLQDGGDVVLDGGNIQLAGGALKQYVDQTSSRTGGGVVTNPSVLPSGLYSVIVVPQGANNESAQASAVCFWDASGTTWTGNGVSVNFTGGAPNVAIGPTAGGATLTIAGASIPAGVLDVRFRQLLGF